jgi:Flp pilus assembly pilin Flp
MRVRLTTLRRHVRDERGQGALEYIGILAIVLLVLTLALAAFNAAGPDITEGVSDIIEEIFSERG